MDLSNLSRQSQWIILAVASGACAAFNGVFAKLTTTELTTNIATSVAGFLGLGSGEKAVEIVIRGIFFALNLIFNGVVCVMSLNRMVQFKSRSKILMTTADVGIVHQSPCSRYIDYPSHNHQHFRELHDHGCPWILHLH